MSINEDEISTADTEDALIHASKHSSGTTINSTENQEKMTQCCQLKKRKTKCAPIWYLIGSIGFFVFGLATIVWTPFEILMEERLRMRPGFPAYEWWKNPPDEVLVRVYIFNVTNSEKFLNKTDAKMNVVEVGPIVFMEKLTHNNVTFNENGTMTYVATRKAIFLPEQTNIDLNATLIVPNWALLGIASYLADESFFVKLGYNLLTRAVKPKQFVTMTIHQLLWNFTDPIMDAAKKVAPFLVPINNMGVLSRIYTDFTHKVTVYTGTKYGHEKFFMIDKYDGSEYLPNYGNSCHDTLNNSTEGVTYRQYITRNTTLQYWRKTFCKNAILTYDHDVTKYGVTAFRFSLPKSFYNRTQPIANDCYKGQPILPNGITDISKCHWGFPVAVSFPHFLYGDDIIKNQLTGFKPNRTKHESYTIIEPYTGVPMGLYVRSQSNLVIRNISGFNELITPFSNTIIPMIWLEYHQVGLPFYIITLIFIQVRIIPIIQWFGIAFLFYKSTAYFRFYYRNRRNRRNDITKFGVNAYKFALPHSAFDRTQPTNLDCFKGYPLLPNGLSDVSKCHWGFPLTSSFPHFLYGDEMLKTQVTGLQPNNTKHGSFLILEPMTGVPMESRARSQSNLHIRKLAGFNDAVQAFSDTVIPMFWLEYNQKGLPWNIVTLIYFQVNLLPIGQRLFTAFLFAGGMMLICFYIKQKQNRQLQDNIVLVFEKELFIKKP